MKWHRIAAMVIRHLYLYPRSIPRLLDIFFWPVMDVLIWGFLAMYLRQIRADVPNLLTLLLGALIFWTFIRLAQQAVTIAFLEEVWERNLLNIFVTPLTIAEFLAATFLLGIIRVGIAIVSIGFIALLFFQFNLFQFGFLLLPFIGNLFFFGWVLGTLATSVILRFGQAAQVLAFALTMLIQPFAAVFYPVSILPGFLQPIAAILPPAHIFEGMREVLFQGTLSSSRLLSAVVLNMVWAVAAVFIFVKMFALVRRRGQLMKLVD